MDLSEAIVPNSQQVNADDLAASPRTVTITNVERGTDEQKVFIHLAEYPGRTYRPSKSMARVLVAVWGKESSTYTGRRLTIYRNPDIMFGPNKVGGIEISHMSDIDKPVTMSLTKSRGQKRNFTVKPLAAETPKPTRDWAAELDLAGDDLEAIAALGAAASEAGASEVGAIRARWNELKASVSS